MKRLNGIWVCLALLWVAMAAQARTMHFYYTDPQGTVLAKTDAQGNILARYDYKPYGGVVSGQGPNGPGYTGHVNDIETGLVYMQARYYDPVGRFLSPDPIAPSAGALFGFNRYDYADNAPINLVDFSGDSPCSKSDPAGCTKAPIRGRPQNTTHRIGDPHEATSQRIADEAARDPSVQEVSLNRTVTKATNGRWQSNKSPDVTITKNDGSVDMVEVVSPSQSNRSQIAKLTKIRQETGMPGNDHVVPLDEMPESGVPSVDPVESMDEALGPLGILELVLHQYVTQKDAQKSAMHGCGGRQCT